MGRQQTWWGTYEVPLDRAGRWQIGPLTLVVCRRSFEWRVGTLRTGDPLSGILRVEVPVDVPEDETGFEIARYAFSETADPLELSPLLADRPVVATPETPFFVLSGDETTAYVSTPLWYRIRVGRDQRTLGEAPIQRPPDTWFGASMVTGELCYGSRTRVRLDLDKQTPLPHRAITPVVIRNSAEVPLLVERVRIPAPNLSAWLAPDGSLWTPRVTLDRQRAELAHVHIDEGPPETVRGGPLLAEARETPEPSTPIMHVFNALLGL